MTTAALRLALIASGAALAVALSEFVRRRAIARSPRWQRENYRGRTVSLLGGPVVVAAAATGAMAVAAAGRGDSRRTALAVLVVLVGAGAVGTYDDLRGDVAAKGLSGHLRAAARGQVTSGTVKVVALGSCGVAAAVVLAGRFAPRVAVDGLLIAATANLANLFDLRPGRAAKLAATGFALVVATGAAAATSLAWCAGVTTGILRDDVHERVMLGDSGANSLGAALGVGVVAVASLTARLAALAVVVGLTLLSEIVSFSRVIDATPPLRWLDGLGRLDGGRRANG